MAAPAFEFDRLSPSSIGALSYANAYRKSLKSSKIHVEHLLMGLYDAKDDSPAAATLRKAGFDRQELINRLTAAGIKLPSGVPADPVAPIKKMPPLSSHTAKAIEMAFDLSAKPDSDKVKSRHLFAGIFCLPECNVPQALPEVRPYLNALVPEVADLMPLTEAEPKMADPSQTEYEQAAPNKVSNLEESPNFRANYRREPVVDLPRP